MTAQKKENYTAADCSETGYGMLLNGKVFVVKPDVLPDSHPGQLFFCTGGNGARPNPIGRSVFAVSLSNGESCRWYRGDIVGVLKPELLYDDARLYLSQIRPDGASAPAETEFNGYCFLKNGRYKAGVPLKDAREAVEFAVTQAPYQHRVLICDMWDCAVMEMAEGRLVYPTREEMEALRQGGAETGQAGDITM